MKNEKKEFSPELKKAIKVYSIELIVFAVVFIVLGILVFTKVIQIGSFAQNIFPYVGIVGAAIMLTDWIWLLCSPKRRAKNAMIDKILLIPSSIALLVCNIYILVQGYTKDANDAMFANVGQDFFQYLVGSALIYFAVIYTFEAIYHWYVPVPALILADEQIDEAEKKKAASLNAEILEENKENNSDENLDLNEVNDTSSIKNYENLEKDDSDIVIDNDKTENK